MDNSVARVGFYSATLAFLAAVGYGSAQILQIAGVLRFPWDEILIYGFSLGIAVPFMLAMLALHYSAPEEKRFWTHAAVLFSVMYATYVSLMYVVQLMVAIPMTLKGTPVPWLQVSRFSWFWALDGIGYIAMGLATAFAAPVFDKQGQQKLARGFFLANALMTPAIIVVYCYPHFSVGLLWVAFPWLITMPGSAILLAISFNAKMQSESSSGYSPFGGAGGVAGRSP